MPQGRELKQCEDGEHQELQTTTTVHCGAVEERLSCNDVKRWICEDGIETRPYGYNPSEEEKDDVVMKKKKRKRAKTWR